MNYKLDIQMFADASAVTGSAVVGHRTWFLANKCVPDTSTINNPVIGMRGTPDLGSAQNTVEANTLDGIREKNVPGYYPATDIEFTLLLADEVVSNQLSYINKEVWVYEERKDMTSTPEKIGSGIIYRIKVSGVVVNGQTPEGLQEITQSATLVSDEFYYAVPTYTSGDEPTWKINGLQTGKSTTTSELEKEYSAQALSVVSDTPLMNTSTTSNLKK